MMIAFNVIINMESKLFVEDEKINVSRSNFTIYKNEQAKYKGKDQAHEMKMKDIEVFILQRPNIVERTSIEILDAVFKLHCCTSRQITEYLNYVKKIDVEQKTVVKILQRHNVISSIRKFEFVSDENTEGTNIKFYTISGNGLILLQQFKYMQGLKGSAHNRLNSSSYSLHAKAYLIRNEYYLKLYKNKINVEDVNINGQLFADGIGMTYKINGILHIVIPVRNYENYKESLINTFKGMKTNATIISNINRKYIILGEDIKFNNCIFISLGQNRLLDMDVLLNDVYYVADLSLFKEKIYKCFDKYRIDVNNNQKRVVVEKSVDVEEFF